MNFQDAQKEFQIRYYLWATLEFEKEINESFPALRLFKSNTPWETLQYMQLLDDSEQRILARALLKRFHPDAVQSLNELCSPKEEDLRNRRDNFYRIKQLFHHIQHLRQTNQGALANAAFQLIRDDAIQLLGQTWLNDEKSLTPLLETLFAPAPPTFGEELAARKSRGEKIKFATKRNIQKTMTKTFLDVFGDQCIDSYSVDKGDLASHFKMNCCGWILSTHFWYGRHESLLEYSHSITSPTSVALSHIPTISSPTMILASHISLCNWLGLTSMTQWEYLTDEEVQPACNHAIAFSKHFFSSAPKLLKGLEFENLTPNKN